MIRASNDCWLATGLHAWSELIIVIRVYSHDGTDKVEISYLESTYLALVISSMAIIMIIAAIVVFPWLKKIHASSGCHITLLESIFQIKEKSYLFNKTKFSLTQKMLYLLLDLS